MDNPVRIPARGGSTRIRHFNGTTRRTSDWDGLRKDGHLWFDGADCLVYFYTEKASQRGASLKLPFEAIYNLGCKYLLDQCLHRRSPCENNRAERTHTLLRNDSDIETAKYELYIPAPSDISREEAFNFHLTTRNLLAYAVGGALVGEKLSTALIELWKRMQEWRLPKQPAAFVTYLEKQGYMDFTENTEHSLACLRLAEEARLRNVWIDSFVHCVGMHMRLHLSPEFAGISNTTLARVTRAALQTDLHLARILRAVGSFLEDDLGPENLGLSKPARDHLDYFRSFLHSFYVNKFGYFPPGGSNPWNKRPCTSMYRDFQNLYDYLADTKSSNDWSNNQSLAGGICVMQNVQSFDLRHEYPSLRHPLPLLPIMKSKPKSGLASYKGFRPLTLVRTPSPVDPKAMSCQAIEAATNSNKTDLLRCALVREYQLFERKSLDGRLDIVEARKVRWLLIYGILQMLNSVVRGPAEVRDSETPSYPVCVTISDLPPWENEKVDLHGDAPESSRASTEIQHVSQALDDLEGRTSRISIHPDCEADCAEDYFAALNISRQDSSLSLSAPTSPLKRSSSFRSSMQLSVQALQRSVVGSLSRRSSNRRASIPLELIKSRSVCGILIEDNAQSTSTEDEPGDALDGLTTSVSEDSQPAGPWGEFDFGFNSATDPGVAPSQRKTQPGREVSVPNSSADMTTGPRESDSPGSSDTSLNSNRSSYTTDQVDSPTTDLSSWDGGSRRGSSASDSTMHVELVAPKKQLSYQPSNPNLNQAANRVGLHGGTYVPKGMLSKSSSTGSASSSGGSVYAEKAVQPASPAEKKKKQKKQKRKSSSLDELANYGIVLDETNVW